MRIIRIAALAAVALMSGTVGIAQSSSFANQNQKPPVDLRNEKTHADSEAMPETTTTVTPKLFTGTLDVTIKTVLATTFPKGTTFLCDLNVSVQMGESYYNYTEIASSYATVSGNLATCVVKLPYAWVNDSATAANIFTASYRVTASYVPSATQPITDFNVIRQTTGPIYGTGGNPVISVPLTGTTTSYSVEAAI